MIDRALKRKWVAALRSGKFRQTTGHLFYKGGYCCLGVLAVQLGAVLNTKGQLILNGAPIKNFGGPEYLRPGAVRGLSKETQTLLGWMNDGAHQTESKNFNKIADWIDANL